MVKPAYLLALSLAFVIIAQAAHASDDYKLGPDSQIKPNVPQGDVTHYQWISKIFPGTVRDYWVYVPKQYNPSSPACVMIFQDGGGFQSRDGQFRVPVVFDNLIAAKEMPVTVAIMIDPGVAPPIAPNALPRYNRSHEYDAVTNTYAQFLVDEILPEVGKNLNLTKDAAGRALCGASSGGICAFTAAWERPDQFSKVISFVGSFTDLQGGNTYASEIRKREPRPIRVLLQDGSADQDIYSGMWYLGNSDVAMALRFAGYDYKFVTGDGGHNGKQGGAILPDALRWIWRDYPSTIVAAAGNRQPVMEVAAAGERWKQVSGISGASGIACDGAGTVYASEPAANRIVKLSAEGSAELTGAANGAAALAFGPDGFLYAAEPNHRRIAAFDSIGRESVLGTGFVPEGLVASHNGVIYATDPRSGKVWMFKAKGKRLAVDNDLPVASGITLSPDQSLLHASQAKPGKFAYSYRIKPDGSIMDKQQYFDLRLDYNSSESNACGMATDTQGRLYITSNTGVQILDQAGRVIGILDNPDRTPTSAITFGGQHLDILYVVAGGKVYSRKLKVKGVLPFQAPILPPGPRL
jgi:enterochelin esterase-like enzyme/sugar lactone lactonase YvrE